jgi:hypothetical protein
VTHALPRAEPALVPALAPGKMCLSPFYFTYFVNQSRVRR